MIDEREFVYLNIYSYLGLVWDSYPTASDKLGNVNIYSLADDDPLNFVPIE